MTEMRAPMRLWDYCTVCVAKIRSMTATDLYGLHGRTPHKVVTENMPDICEYTNFDWYARLWYYDDLHFLEERRLLG